MHYTDRSLDRLDLSATAKIYVLDFSLQRDALLTLEAQGHEVLVLDHHKTAEEDLRGLSCAKFDMGKSGARLAWEHFHPDTPIPKFVLAVEDRDLWRFVIPHTKEILAAASLLKFKFSEWDKFCNELEANYGDVVTKGEAILAYQQERAQSSAKKIGWRTIQGHKVPFLNSTSLISETLNHVLELNPEAPFAISFFMGNDEKFIYSLRSRGDFDVGAFAKTYGGGGHAAAAGFSLPYIFPKE